MLYRPEDFDTLTDETWHEERIRAGIREIVADTESALRGPHLLWPADDWDRWHSTNPLKTLFVGAAGVVWALDELQQRGHAETRLDLAELALGAVDRYRAFPDYARETNAPEPRHSSLLCGETGILLVTWSLTRRPELADALHARVSANLENQAEEIMWGTPGTLIAARLVLDATGDERWRAIASESSNALLARQEDDGLWTQRMHGQTHRFLGPVHGAVGNVAALLQLGDEETRARLRRTSNEVLARTAVVEDGLANWPPIDRPELESRDGAIRVQWCHGAPGIVTAASTYLDEELLLAGAELTWRAGPHGDDKGSSICHGTAGNGHAFLKTFARTGDEKWLERARRFAVHALEQVRRRRTKVGRGRYSLWTGDLGVALYLADCLDARSAYPVLDA